MLIRGDGTAIPGSTGYVQPQYLFDRYYVGDDIYFRVTSRIYSGANHSVIFCARKYYFKVTLVLNPIMLWLWQQVAGFVPQD